MVYPSIDFEWTPGQTALCYIVFWRDQLPGELALEYWTNPHATLVCRSGGIHQYRTHMLDVERTGCWPQLDGVQTSFPAAWRPDGIAEATVLNTSAFAPSPLMESVLNDEQNFLRRGLAYFTRPNGSVWHRQELTPCTADLHRSETRIIALIRPRIGAPKDAFADFIQKELVGAITRNNDIVETKTMVFAPYNENVWPSVGLSHEHPEGLRYHAAVIVAGCNRTAVATMFRSAAFQATHARQSELFECLHSIEVKNTVFMVENGKLQTPALRGFAIAQILSQVGATSQTEEPVLSQVLAPPKAQA
ncbi:MAG: hypothetical protein ACR2PG_24020 [Hyphomicrobiaceae bacterium]